jgi:CheY-like chemotaxis protein
MHKLFRGSPQAAEAAEACGVTREKPRRGRQTMARILVIDDDQPVRAAIAVVLETAGFEVVTAADGRAGKAAAETTRFDVTIVDLFMPHMDGLETIRSLRHSCPDMPIIAVSGALSLFDFRDVAEPPPDYLSMATDLGAITAVQKPFQPRELIRAVRESIAAHA